MTNTPSIALQPTTTADLESLFVFQLDEEAIHQAAFTPLHPHDKEAYLAKYTRLLSDPSINMHTIRVGGAIVGSIAKFEMEGDAEITYWLDRRFWGRALLRQPCAPFSTWKLPAPSSAGRLTTIRALSGCWKKRVSKKQAQTGVLPMPGRQK